MSKLSKSLKTAGGLTSRVSTKSLSRPSLVQASPALNQRQSRATPSTQDCNLTYSEYQVPPSMSGTAGPPRSHAHKSSRDLCMRRATQGINADLYVYRTTAGGYQWNNFGEGSYGHEDPDVPFSVPDAGPASLYIPTTGKTSDQAATNDGIGGWLSTEDYTLYRPRYERVSQLYGPPFLPESIFAELCKATDGWAEDEIGELLAESRALDRISREAVVPDDYPFLLAEQLDTETEWVRNSHLGPDAMLYMIPPSFDWWNSETYRSVTLSGTQRKWANQRTT